MGAFGWEGWEGNLVTRVFGLSGQRDWWRWESGSFSGSRLSSFWIRLGRLFSGSCILLICCIFDTSFFFSPNYKSQLNKCLKSKSKIKWNPLLVEPSHFKVANTFQAIFLVLPDISMSHSSLSSLYNDLEHMRRIWIYLVKCFFNQVSLPTKILHA